MNHDINQEAQGRWRGILTAMGVDEAFLTGKHGPCPFCQGTDRFRWDDKGTGNFYCSVCGPGSGMEFVKRLFSVDFKEAVKLVREKLPGSAAIPTKPQRTDADTRKMVRTIWITSQEVSPACETAVYLKRRGFPALTPTKVLRNAPRLSYGPHNGVIVEFPAMVAAIQDKGGKIVSIHRTYIKDGQQAPVEQPKKVLGKVPTGAAVRLFPATDTLGVAEGIETALAAQQIFKIPVWSVLNAGAMERWDWPAETKTLLCFGDNDSSYTGAKAAYTLAYRARSKGLKVEVLIPSKLDTDWADVVRGNNVSV